MRSSRVCSRNREIRPATAAARSARPASLSANSPSNGGAPRRHDLLAVDGQVRRPPTNHPSGSRPDSHAAASSAPGRSACCHPPRPGPRPPRPPAWPPTMHPSRHPRLPLPPQRLRDYTATCAPRCFARAPAGLGASSLRAMAPGTTGPRTRPTTPDSRVQVEEGRQLASGSVTGRSHTKPRQT